eukprot:2214754-Amphidinium_carterae.1
MQQTLRSNDVSVKTFSKPKTFDGTDAAWPQWSWRLEAATTHLGMEDAFHMAGTQRPDQVGRLQDMDDHVRQYAKQLYGMLVECCEGKAAAILRTCERGNGFHCWS